MTESLNVLLDQNIPVAVKAWLTKIKPGWQVYHASDAGLSSQSDECLFQWAKSKKAVIVTYDEDFADARMYSLGSHQGIIRLKVWPTTIENTCQALQRLFESTSDEQWLRGLVIIDNHKIRIRVPTT